jgi:hypothetical protein
VIGTELVEIPSSMREKMKHLLLVAVAVVGLSLLAPAVAIAGPNGCPNDVGKTCVPGPTQAPTAPPGATAVCRDGSYSFSQHHTGTCSGHGGVSEWLSADSAPSALYGQMDMDVQGFYDSLERADIPNRTPEMRSRNLQMGLAICNAYATALNNDQVGLWLGNLGYSAHDAAMWTVSSVDYLCPQYGYMLGH